MNAYREIYGDYWTGPAGMQVPLTTTSVPALDGINVVQLLLMDGRAFGVQTRLKTNGSNGFTEASYRRKFAEMRDNGQWYWKGA